MTNRLLHIIETRRRSIIILATALSLLAAMLATRLPIDFSPEALFQGNDDLVKPQQAFAETFGVHERVTLVVLEAHGDTTLLDPTHLTWIYNAGTAVAAIPHVDSIFSLARLKIPRAALVPFMPLLPLPVISEVPVTQEDADALQNALNRSGKLSTQWLSENRKVGLMILNLNQDVQQIKRLAPLVEKIRAALATVPLPDTLSYSLTGLPSTRAHVVQSIKSDQTFLIPITGLLFLGFLAWVFRKPVGVILPLASVGVGILWSLAVYVLMDQPITLISNGLPVLLMIIGISNGVHIVSRYSEESAKSPGHDSEAARRTMNHMVLACGLTILTTAIGFASLLAGRSRLLQSMGWQALSGLTLLYLAMVLVFALYLGRFAAPTPPKENAPIASAVRIMGRLVVQYRYLWFASALIAVAAAIWSGSRVQINSGFMETYEKDHPAMLPFAKIDQELGGFLRLEVWIRNKEGSLLTPEAFERLHRFQKAADAHPSILSSFSYVDLHQHLIKESGQFGDKTPPLPSLDKDGLSQLKIVRSMVNLLHDIFQPYHFITQDHTQARVLLRLSDLGTRESLKVIADIEKTIQETFPENSKYDVQLTGEVYVNSVAVDRFIRDLSYSFLGAAAVIFAIIALLFRSVLFGLVAVLPNLTPLILTMGYMGVRGYDLNAGNVVVFALSLGIAVDNTIHFLARFREEIEHHPVNTALRRTIERTGRAIVISSVIIISGLGILMLSEFLPTRHFAELTSFTMLSAMLGDLILLPATLAVCWPTDTERSKG